MNRVHSQEVDLILTKIYENGDKIYMPCKILNSVIFKIANPLFYNALLGKPHNTNTFYDVIHEYPWGKHITIEKEHKDMYNSIHQWYQVARTKNISNNKIDKILFKLTMQILLLNTDGLKHQLKNKKLVELARQKYASMLHYYLKCQHPENHSTLLARRSDVGS